MEDRSRLLVSYDVITKKQVKEIDWKDGKAVYKNITNPHYMFPSLYDIGQRVKLKIEGDNDKDVVESDNAVIRAIIFTQGKIRYSIRINGRTTLHNVDSVSIVEGFDDFTELDFDNYS